MWDAVDVERVKMATDPKLSADVAAVLITVCGMRFVLCLLSVLYCAA